MGLEEELTYKMSRELAEHIDFDIMSSLLVDSCNWTRVYLDYMNYDPNTGEIMSWANANCAGRFMNFAEDFIFENANDALMFKLKWS